MNTIKIMARESFDMEFIFKASPAIVYRFITDPACVIRWFCDAIDIQGDIYTFYWDGSEEIAELIDDIEEERLRFRWQEADDEDEYFEFRMSKSPMTGETILELTDFGDKDEISEQRDLWTTQIERMRLEAGG